MDYRPTIGLEIHAELKTRTKMFCNCANDPDEMHPNINICPICTAHPGTLPVINQEAVRQVLRVGAAAESSFGDMSEFDRKSYFYPDIPKGYQISQYARPLIVGGTLANVTLTRVHLEEDTARSIHAGGKSFVDFNRAGVPLMELVTEPVIHDAETAGYFARELQLLLRTLGAGEANLEKGEMRIEANISVSKTESLGTKVEVKNLNSFRSVERAIAFEIKRQRALLEKGGEVMQETRGWNESKQETFHQRFKEGSADYRYFPEPDLPKLFLFEPPEFSFATIHASLPELPWERRARYGSLGVRRDYIETFLQNDFLNTLFEEVANLAEGDIEILQLAGNYLISDIQGLLEDTDKNKNSFQVKGEDFLKVMRMVKDNMVSSRGAKDILTEMYRSGVDPETIAREHNLIQTHDSVALTAVVDAVLAGEGKAVLEYKNGKLSALQYLIGKAMKESHGTGNPSELQKLFLEKIG